MCMARSRGKQRLSLERVAVLRRDTQRERQTVRHVGATRLSLDTAWSCPERSGQLSGIDIETSAHSDVAAATMGEHIVYSVARPCGVDLDMLARESSLQLPLSCTAPGMYTKTVKACTTAAQDSLGAIRRTASTIKSVERLTRRSYMKCGAVCVCVCLLDIDR